MNAACLDHVGLAVENLDPAIAFFTEVDACRLYSIDDPGSILIRISRELRRQPR